MTLFRTRFDLETTQRPQVVRALSAVLAPTRALPGCASCELCSDVDDPNVLVLIGEWLDEESLRAYLRGQEFKAVLSALEYAVDVPDVRFDTVADTRGMELVTACLADSARNAAE